MVVVDRMAWILDQYSYHSTATAPEKLVDVPYPYRVSLQAHGYHSSFSLGSIPSLSNPRGTRSILIQELPRPNGSQLIQELSR